jgi:hypothetical protein
LLPLHDLFIRDEHCSNKPGKYFTVDYCYHFMFFFVTTENRPLGRHRHRWEDNIKEGSSGSGMYGAWTGLIWLRIGTGGGLL